MVQHRSRPVRNLAETQVIGMHEVTSVMPCQEQIGSASSARRPVSPASGRPQDAARRPITFPSPRRGTPSIATSYGRGHAPRE